MAVLVPNAVGDDKLISDEFVAWGAVNDPICKSLTRYCLTAVNDPICKLLTRYCLTAVRLGPGAF